MFLSSDPTSLATQLSEALDVVCTQPAQLALSLTAVLTPATYMYIHMTNICTAEEAWYITTELTSRPDGCVQPRELCGLLIYSCRLAFYMRCVYVGFKLHVSIGKPGVLQWLNAN